VFAYAIEAYVSVVASDYTDPLALRMIQLVFEYLPRAFADPSNTLAREKMHNASTIAGMAFANTFLGINHCMAHIPHGRANAFMMTPVIRYNSSLPRKFVGYPKYGAPKGKQRYAEIAEALKLPAATPDKGCASLIKAIEKLKSDIGISATIADAGINHKAFEAEVRHMTEVAFDDQCVGANPCYSLVEDLADLFRESYGRARKKPKKRSQKRKSCFQPL